jgi:hypothetical protein
MNLFRILLICAVLPLAAPFATAHAADVAIPARVAPAPQQQEVDDHDDTRVEVQLVVLGLAAFTVLGVGIGAYLLRKRLGLVEGPPEQPAGGHH